MPDPTETPADEPDNYGIYVKLAPTEPPHHQRANPTDDESDVQAGRRQRQCRAAVEALKPRPGEIPCTITVGPPPPEIRFVPVYLPPGYGPMRA